MLCPSCNLPRQIDVTTANEKKNPAACTEVQFKLSGPCFDGEPDARNAPGPAVGKRPHATIHSIQTRRPRLGPRQNYAACESLPLRSLPQCNTKREARTRCVAQTDTRSVASSSRTLRRVRVSACCTGRRARIPSSHDPRQQTLYCERYLNPILRCGGQGFTLEA